MGGHGISTAPEGKCFQGPEQCRRRESSGLDEAGEDAEQQAVEYLNPTGGLLIRSTCGRDPHRSSPLPENSSDLGWIHLLETGVGNQEDVNDFHVFFRVLNDQCPPGR